MLDGYNRIFWAHAANSVLREIDIPDPALGIDGVGVNDAVPLRLRPGPGQKQRIVKTPTHDVTYMQPKGSGEAVRPEDFPNTGYVGEYALGW